MKHLSTLDSFFLHIETAEMPMHVGSLIVVELPKGYRGDFYEDVKSHLGRRLHLAPVFQQKLATIPLELANPVWVEDDEVDLDYHVRRAVLRKPGTWAQLESHVGRLHSNRLDRSRPLWEIYVFEGLPKRQAAIYLKFHHAGMDGAAGVVVANAMLDTTPEPREVPPPKKGQPRHERPGTAALATAAVTNLASQYVKLVKLLPNAAKAVARLALPAAGAPAAGAPVAGVPASPATDTLPRGWEFAPKTPLNVTITGQRAFAARSLSLADAKVVAKAFGVTINDVVMAVCSGALRDYLRHRGGVPDRSLVAVVPVSLRDAGDMRQNNQIILTLESLASDVADPVERLRAIHSSGASVKRYTGSLKSALPLDFPIVGAPWLLGGLALLYSRTAELIPQLGNVLVSNVRGPQFPLYLAGAKLLTYAPISIPFHGVALNITVHSYNGSLDFGLAACRRAVPKVSLIADRLGDALEELTSLAASAQAEAAAAPVARAGAKALAARASSDRSPSSNTPATRPAAKTRPHPRRAKHLPEKTE